MMVDTGALRLPTGTTGERPNSPVTGYIRWNTSLGAVELYNGSTWIQYYGENGTSNAPYTSLANLSADDPGSGYWYIKFDGTNIEEVYAYKDTNGNIGLWLHLSQMIHHMVVIQVVQTLGMVTGQLHQLLVLQEMRWDLTSSQIITEDGQQMMY